MKHNSKTILVVEDDSLISNILQDHLKKQNFNVLIAENGKIAVETILKNKPDLVLLDLLLPEMDGYQVLQTIRQNPDKVIAQTLVIVLSNLWSDKDILSAQALKIEAYFIKSNTDLKQVIEQVKLSLAKTNK